MRLFRIWKRAQGLEYSSRKFYSFHYTGTGIGEENPQKVLEEIHNGKSGADLGTKKTSGKIRERFYFVEGVILVGPVESDR